MTDDIRMHIYIANSLKIKKWDGGNIKYERDIISTMDLEEQSSDLRYVEKTYCQNKYRYNKLKYLEIV